MQKNELIRAWIFLVIFWWMAAWIAYGYEQFSQWLSYWSDFFLVNVASWFGVVIEQSVFRPDSGTDHALPESLEGIASFLVSEHWTMLGFSVVFLSALSGLVLSLSTHHARTRAEEKKIRPGSGWRGVTLSIGDLPLPVWKVSPPVFKEGDQLKFAELTDDLKMAEQFQALFDGLQEPYQRVLRDVLWLIKEHKTAPVGKGHAEDTKNGEGLLLEHTLRVMVNGWKNNNDPLLPLALAAHDLGKIRIWDAKDFGVAGHTWSDRGYHDERGAMMIGSLDSMDFLPDDERAVLPIVVRYSHKPWALPEFSKSEYNDRAQKLLESVRDADHETTKQEKLEIIQKSPEDVYIDSFIETLKSIRWNSPETPRGSKNQGWRKGSLVCLLEPDFREIYVQHLPEDLAAALGNGYRSPGKPAQATMHLMDILKRKGWLLTIYRGVNAHESGLWYLDAGMKKGGFQGVIALEAPDELLFMPETGHEIQLGIYNTDKPIEFEGDPPITKEEKAVIAMSALFGAQPEKIRKVSKRNKRIVQVMESAGTKKPEQPSDAPQKSPDKSASVRLVDDSHRDAPQSPLAASRDRETGDCASPEKKPNSKALDANQGHPKNPLSVDESMYDIF